GPCYVLLGLLVSPKFGTKPCESCQRDSIEDVVIAVLLKGCFGCQLQCLRRAGIFIGKFVERSQVVKNIEDVLVADGNSRCDYAAARFAVYGDARVDLVRIVE